MNLSLRLRQFSGLLLPLMLSACFVAKDKIADIPNAENILITSNHKLIVSGGQNIYEIKSNNGAYERVELFDGLNERSFWNVKKYGCQFTGIAQHENFLFTSCVSLHFVFKNNHLLYADLNAPVLKFKMLTEFDDNQEDFDQLSIPNGMAMSPDGALLVADENFLADSGIARIELDFSGDKPRIIRVKPNWISPQNHGVHSANGLRVAGDYVYFSDHNKIKRGRFNANGQIQDLITMWTNPVAYPLSVIDDIMPYCGGVALTDFITGQLHYVASYVDQQGEEHFPVVYSTLPFSYANPSSLAYGALPELGITSSQILVTEKGNLLDNTSSYGNKLVASPLTLDLDDPNVDVCQMINDLAPEFIQGS